MSIVKLLYAESQEEMDKSVGEQIRLLPITVQAMAAEAYRRIKEEEFDQAIVLCQKALETEPLEKLPAVRMLLGTAYMGNNEPNAAKNVFLDLLRENPSDEEARMFLGFAHHNLMEFNDAVRELKKLYPPKTYVPYFRNAYADSLQYTGHQKEAREIFREEVDDYERTGEIPDAETLDGTYQNLLYLDAKLANGAYPEDVESYFRFLDRIEMTDRMQGYLSGTISRLSTLMEYTWFRPLFQQFVDKVEEKGYITSREYARVIESARISMESYEYHSDPKVNAMVEEFLNSYYSYTFAKEDAELNEAGENLSEGQKEKQKSVLRGMEVKAKTYAWNMTKYYSGHREELDYVKKQYPHAYLLVEPFLEETEKDPEKKQEELLHELYRFNRGGYSIETFRNSLESAYQKLAGDAEDRQANLVHGGSAPYRRGHAKIGRNDPCPCGSGKKYKNCCGRNA